MSDFLLNAGGHLPPEVAFGYEHGDLSPDEILAVHRHVEGCAACRESLSRRMDAGAAATDVRGALGGAPARPSLLARGGAVAAAAVIAVTAAVLWRARRETPSREVPAAASAEDAAVREALRSGKLPLPSFLAELSPPKETMMGAPSGQPSGAFSPAATAVFSGTPRFSWKANPGAWTYEVRVFSLAGDAVAASPPLPNASWVPDRPLEPGDFQWQVEATRGAERATLPEPPASPPRFRVLDRAAADRLAGLVRTRPGDPVALAVEYARAGAVEDARRALETALRRDPDRADVRALLLSLRRPS